MQKTWRGIAAVLGFLVILFVWIIYKYSTPAAPRGLQPFDLSKLEELTKQLNEQLQQASASFGSNFCVVTFASIPDKVRLNQSFNLEAQVSLPDNAEGCASNLAVYGAAFSIEPKETKKVSLDNKAPTEAVIFNLLPTKPGKQLFVYGYDNTIKQAETTVYQYPSISPNLSIWFPILGTFFGGTLTLPWWLTLFGIPKSKENNHKKKKK
jgi:hypothetical protein